MKLSILFLLSALGAAPAAADEALSGAIAAALAVSRAITLPTPEFAAVIAREFGVETSGRGPRLLPNFDPDLPHVTDDASYIALRGGAETPTFRAVRCERFDPSKPFWERLRYGMGLPEDSRAALRCFFLVEAPDMDDPRPAVMAALAALAPRQAPIASESGDAARTGPIPLGDGVQVTTMHVSHTRDDRVPVPVWSVFAMVVADRPAQ